MSIAISVILLILTLLAYRPTAESRRLTAEFGLRLLVIFILIAIILDKVFAFSWHRPSRKVAVLIDHSQSMKALGAEKSLAGVINYIRKRVPTKMLLEKWSFADSVVRSPDGLDSAAGEERTRLGRALETVLRHRPGAVVVLSDGQDNGEKDPVAIAEKAKVPIYTVGFGSQRGRNLMVREVFIPPIAYAFDTILVKVRLQSEGFSPEEKVTLHITPLETSKEVLLSSLVSEQEVLFPIVFTSPGHKTLTVFAESLTGELTYLDNFKKASVEVKPERIQVVYLTNRPGPNCRFILQALRNDKRVTVFPVLILTADSRLAVTNGDVFIIDGMQERSADAALLEEVCQKVEAGAGAFILAGPEFSSGEKLRRLLPLSELRRLTPAMAAAVGFYPELTEAGQIFSWFSGYEIDKNSIPPLKGVLTGTPLDNSTIILKVAESGEPLLAAGRVKRGKVVYFGGWDIWRWGFLPDFSLDRTTPLAILLNGVIRYLSEKDTLLFRLKTNAFTYLAGEPVSFTFTAFRPDGRAWEGLDVVLLISPNGMRVPMIEQEPGIYRAEVPGLNAGKYFATAEVPLKLGSRDVRPTVEFEVSQQSIEMTKLGTNRRLLSRVAAITGGFFVPAESLETFSDFEIKPVPVKGRLSFDPRGSPWWLAIGAALFGVELFFRRRKGLL